MGREEFKWVDIKDAVKLNFVKYSIQLFNLGSLCMEEYKLLQKYLRAAFVTIIRCHWDFQFNTGAQDAKPSQHYKYHRGLLGRMQTIVNIIAKTPPKQRGRDEHKNLL